MNAEGARARDLRLPALALCVLLLLIASACHVEAPPGREEKYVTVRLHDSLSRFDSVEVLLLADGDSSAVVGRLWGGPLAAPIDIPSFRLDASEQRNLTVSVKGWDAHGRLAFVQTIAKVDGKQVVTIVPQPQPSPRLQSLTVDAGTLNPPFQPGVHAYTVSLPYSQASLRITSTPVYAYADVYVDIHKTEAGKPSEAIPLQTGSNRIAISVKAADTSVQYSITAARASDPDDTVIIVPPDTNGRDTLYKAWKKSGLVLLDFDQIGLAPDFEIVDFPLLLRLTRENFRFSEAAAKGADIRFATTDGKPMDFEIARWDASAQVAEIYVRMDTLGYEDIASVLMYWGNPAAATASAPAKVFRTAGDWGGVWHLEEDGDEEDYRDATGQFDGTGKGDVPARRDGMVGKAQDFRTTNSPSWIEVPEGYDFGQQSFTMHMWIKKQSITNMRLMSKDGPSSNDQRFTFDVAAMTGQFSFGTHNVIHKSNVYLPEQAWTLLGLSFDGTRIHLYIDGAERESWDYKVMGSPANEVIIGAQDDKGYLGYKGLLDEIWSLRKFRGKEYMRLIYENQKSWSTFAALLAL